MDAHYTLVSVLKFYRLAGLVKAQVFRGGSF
jgi:hypothetical protein